MKVREFHPTKGGLTPKGSFRHTEYRLQSKLASRTSELATVTRKHGSNDHLLTSLWTKLQLTVVARGKSHGTTAIIHAPESDSHK